jgi:hypothetical protein
LAWMICKQCMIASARWHQVVCGRDWAANQRHHSSTIFGCGSSQGNT